MALFVASPLFVSSACLEDRGSVFRIAYDLSYGGAENMDPYDPNAFWPTVNLVFNRLVSADERGFPVPRLAVQWEASEDGLVWTFSLRRGVLFHDGSAFDADDVAYSFQRILAPESDSPMMVTLAVIDRVEVLESHRVRFFLRQPDFDFPILLLDYRVLITPEGSAETIREHPIGTGPFRVVKLDPDGTTVLVAHSGYFDGAPRIEQVQIVAIPDNSAKVQALLGGQIDFIDSIEPLQARIFERAPGFQVDRIASGNWNGLSMRADLPPFDDWRVRKALRVAVDRSDMMTMVLGEGGGEVSCDDPVWSGDPYWMASECGPDIPLARRLLADAGYPDGISVQLFTSDVEENFLTLAAVYQEQVKKAGIRVEIRVASSDGYWNDVGMKEPFYVTSWGQRPAPQVLNEAFRSDARTNETHWRNPQFDALIASARSEPDPVRRRELYFGAQRLLFEEGSTLIPYHRNLARVYGSRVRGVDRVVSDYLRWERISLDG
jgi:peptide/nickel transport system substrate-binding protein